MEDGGGAGSPGPSERISADGRRAVLRVEADPDEYWPVGTDLLVDLDHETQLMFTD